MLTLQSRTRTLLVVSVFPVAAIGAGVGAGWNPPLTNSYSATAIVIPAGAPGGIDARRQLAAELIAVAQRSGIGARAANAVSPLGGVPVRPRFEISVTPSGAAMITSVAPTASDATEGASAYAAELTSLAKSLVSQLTGSGILPLTDFSKGQGGWGAPSMFSLSPVSIRVTRNDAGFGSELLANCGNRNDCGVATHFYYAFAPSVLYRLDGWVRSTALNRTVRLVLGVNPSDYGVSRPVSLSSGWTRISTAWIPKSYAAMAEADVQQVNGASGGFALAGLVLADPAVAKASIAPVTLTSYRSLTRAAPSVAVFPPDAAQPSTRPAVASAGIGAVVALVLLGAACFSMQAALAQRRRAADAGSSPPSVTG